MIRKLLFKTVKLYELSEKRSTCTKPLELVAGLSLSHPLRTCYFVSAFCQQQAFSLVPSRNSSTGAMQQYHQFNSMHLQLLYSWCFSRYNTPIQWLVHGHLTSNKETVLHYENYGIKRETVQCYPRNVPLMTGPLGIVNF